VKMVENTTLLRDYATQVREAFEAERDIKANDLMKIFTVVTSIFLPLSLVVGWYGMNFKYMPEYSWKYGYAYLIGLNAAIVLFMLGLFIRKKWI
ncbi:MAG TPA: CorA family divalent cation transporter, partial [Bacillota bacterium]|nr:CorA family divalent cation transporter [Bacillota bacterium]